ncbi:MAG TPA: flagellar filament capping protein FliD [Pseudoxanthomonas sp.]|nr:flagellar filament capping protein FliD [Pseudoxanthomonas sp.]
MADYSLGYGGIGTGLDITGMVKQLVAADRAPADASLNRIESGAKFKLSALGTVKSAFNALEGALKALKAPDAFDTRSVRSGTESVLAASAGKSTPTGTYSVEVLALASANKWVGATPTASTQTFGAGRLTLNVGSETLTIDIAQGSSLAQVRTAIDSAARGKGVQASVLTSNGGQYLSLSSDKTGAANAISLSVSTGGSDLQALVGGLQQRTPAADARISIDGLVIAAGGNRVSDAVPGLVLDLKTEGISRVTVGGDAASSRKVVQDFVSAYNSALNAINAATKYDAANNRPSALTGDAQMRGAAGQLRSVMGSLLGELSAAGLDARTLGLQTKGYPSSDGTLVLDGAKFDAAMAANPEKIRSAFTGASGFAGRLEASVASYLGNEGAFTQRSNSLDAQLKDVASRRSALDQRMEAVGNRYKAQFVAMDAMVAQMNSTSSYLAQQIAGLPKSQDR